MATKALEKLGSNLTAAAWFAAVFIANWASAEYLNYPFVWCWGKRLIQPVFEPWLFIVNFMALGYFIVCFLKRDPFKVAISFIVVILVFSMPMICRTLFELGKSCG